MKRIIDSHIHLDIYEEKERKEMIDSLDSYHVQALITVSNHLQSAKENLALAKNSCKIKPAFGYHPEQDLPRDEGLQDLLSFIDKHAEEMIAVGEVGLPYYLARKNPNLKREAYIELLEAFIVKAKELDKPIILHAIYEDATIACDLLEKHSIGRAHFHWFKGSMKTIQRLVENQYVVSITPDVSYEQEIRELVTYYPLDLLMTETDGPWKFKGPYKNEYTHPRMIHDIISEISKLKELQSFEVYNEIYRNTKSFYKLNNCFPKERKL